MKKIILSSDNEQHKDHLFPVYYWNGFKNSEYYINHYIEKNKNEIRNIYLKFIENINIIEPSKKKIEAIFGSDEFHSLWHMSSIAEKCPNKSLVTNNCIKLIAFEQILEIVKPNIVRLNSKDVGLYYSIKNLCKRKNIKFESNLLFLFYFKKNFNLPVSNFIKTIYFILKKFFICFSTKKNDINFNSNDQICLISYFFNYKIQQLDSGNIEFFSEYWHNLTDLIHKFNKKINWLHLGIDSKAIKTFNNLQGNNHYLNGKNSNHILIDNNLSLPILFLSLGTFIKVSLKSLFICNVREIFNVEKSDINLYPFLKNDWITSSRGSHLFYSIITIKIFDNLLSKLPNQKLGLYLLENQSWERALIGSWKKFNHGKLVGVDHTGGYMRYWDLRFYRSFDFFQNPKNKKFINDLHCINGSLSKELLIQSGFPKDMIIDVEALRFNYLKNNITNSNMHDLKYNKILLVGDIDYNSSKNLLLDIQSILCKIKNNFEICFRPHPGTPNKDRLIEFAKSLEINISTSELMSDITNHYKIIIVGSSTVSIEAYLMKKQIIVYLDREKLNLSPINIIQQADLVSNSDDLLDSIKKDLKFNNRKNEFFWLDHELPKWKIFFDEHLKN